MQVEIFLISRVKVEKILKGSLYSIPSPSPENSNYGQESLLEVYVKVKTKSAYPVKSLAN